MSQYIPLKISTYTWYWSTCLICQSVCLCMYVYLYSPVDIWPFTCPSIPDLSYAHLPIWLYQVRALAEQYQLPTRARKDSQGICFLGKLKFDEFMQHYLGQNEGDIRCYQSGLKFTYYPIRMFFSYFRLNNDLNGNWLIFEQSAPVHSISALASNTLSIIFSQGNC